MTVLNRWWQQYLADSQVVVLLLLLVLGIGTIVVAGNIVAPIVASIIIAYVLDGAIEFLRKKNMPRNFALFAVYFLFIGTVIVMSFSVLPLLTEQVALFLRDLPNIISNSHSLLMQLPATHPEYIKPEYIDQLFSGLRNEMVTVGQTALSLSLSSVLGFITVLIYVLLVPLLIFFFLKDKATLIEWFKGILPKKENQTLTHIVWSEVNLGVAGYIRGKLIEIVIVWAVSWIVFALFGLKYAPLLSFLVGLSVIIPFIGAIVVMIPVVLVAYAQWGLDNQTLSIIVVYLVLQFLDGNILVPILFSEIVNLHPIAIISAVLVFGGIWGFWGVFFAIPLATLANAVLKAWPRYG